MNPFAVVGRLFRRPRIEIAPRAELMTTVRNAAAAPFEAAGSGRRARGWSAPTLGPNDVILSSQSTLRDRSRAATRNNGYANDIIDKLTTNLVGAGVCPQSLAPDAAFRDRVHRVWAQWTDEADSAGTLDFYGLQALAVRSWLESGEVFIRIRPRLLRDKLTVPLQLELVESESCPSNYSAITPTGNTVRSGIEHDAIGRRTAYFFYTQRRGYFNDLQRSELARIPARNINGNLLVSHLFEPIRPNQIRGVPHLVRTLLKLHDLDAYDDAHLLRTQLSNMFVAFLVPGPSAVANSVDPLTGKAIERDSDGRATMALEPGQFHELEPGEDVRFSQPPDPSGYSEYMRSQLMGAAVAAGIPYELLTGDLREVSDRALRVILNEFRRKIERQQHHLIAFQLCRPVWDSWFTQALISGALPVPDDYEQNPKIWQRVEWIAPKIPYLHPVQDAESERALVRSGFKSRSQVVKELGYDIEQLDREIAADNARADELGLVFDSDPRKTGPSQTTAVPEATPTTTSASGQVIKRLIREPNGRVAGVVEDHIPGVRVPKVRVTNNIQTPKPEVNIENHIEVPKREKRTQRIERDAKGRIIRIVEE